ncbi:flagellar protein FlaI [Halorubrum alkaliphilum]|uniref:Flagellar protein FlaI n=1 Tax=Halorubrum alkaliphilum TaxID=261290 RepID=A0A8T4GFX0_9EURY|nr:type II/IV secretion system ATPase subunit [Halorubrum alkaliphilum]MBP1922082.1 flagellar protein FlaI [Halorubrum alkaliphilum]
MDGEDAERQPATDGRERLVSDSARTDTAEGDSAPADVDPPVTVGRYTWRSVLREHGHVDAAEELYEWIPEAPAVPASAVKARVDDRDTAVVRVSGVDQPFETDGETPVDGHGTPAAGTLVIGSDDVVASGSAVYEDRRRSVDETRGTTVSRDDTDDRVGGRSETTDTNEAGEPDPPDEHGVGEAVGRNGVSGLVVVAGADVEPVPAGPPTDLDWERVAVDPAEFLGFHPDELGFRLRATVAVGDELWDRGHARYDLYEVPVLKGYYTWSDFEDQWYRDEEGTLPTDEEDEPIPFTHEHKIDALGFDPGGIESVLDAGAETADRLADLVDERTVDVNPELDEDAFFSTVDGETTLANRYDLEKAVPMAKKTHFREVERYWVNEPYAFVIVFRSTKENEVKYYVVQPYLTSIESDLAEFLTGKLRTSIKYADESITGEGEGFREGVIADETRTLLERYDLYEGDDEGPLTDLLDRIDLDGLGVDLSDGLPRRIAETIGYRPPSQRAERTSRISARPEPAVLAEDAETLSGYQVEKLLYYLKRDFIGYERIDPIKHDINVEDISCDGYDSPVFVYHSDYEQVITNVYHGTDELDDFVVKLAQRSGKGISKRRPQVDATLPDGSRAQLTLGREVSDHGTNYTIRQFKDVPFTPVDLINWKTFSLDEMAFLWICIENNKNLIFAGGTASGKTTSLNAVSLFIPSNAKIVSIEDTREVELPQRNWIASVTRPSFSDDDKGDVDEFDLLEAALRQRPDYIVMGEIRGEEGRTAFQVMSTGHTTYTTFHADSVGEVLKRFTTDPINVSKTMFSALDLVSIQTSTRVQGKKVRRNKSLTEINHYDAENDEINVQDVFQWQAETDEFLRMGDSNTLEEIMFDRGWSRATLDEELRKRRLVLAYLIDRGLNSYAQVAATFQAFINDPETVLALMANDELERSLEDLREMESVLINVDREKEAMVPRPEPDEAGREEAKGILEDAEDLLGEYRGSVPESVADALLDVDPARDVEARPNAAHDSLAEAARTADRLTDRIVSDDAGSGSEDTVGDTGHSVVDGPDRSGDAEASIATGDESAVSAGEGIDRSQTSTNGESGTLEIDESFDEPFPEGVDVMSPPPTEESRGDDDDAVDTGSVEGATSSDGAVSTEAVEDGEDAADTDDDAEGSDAADAEGSDAADANGDIDEWGFETVEPAEEEG